ncbi:hypothetical protein PV760_10890 [Paenarthrobacter sp. CC6]
MGRPILSPSYAEARRTEDAFLPTELRRNYENKFKALTATNK